MVDENNELFGLDGLPPDAITESHPTLQNSAFTAVLTELNKLKKEGEIKDYAIAGGYASIYHSIPYFTEDVGAWYI